MAARLAGYVGRGTNHGVQLRNFSVSRLSKQVCHSSWQCCLGQRQWHGLPARHKEGMKETPYEERRQAVLEKYIASLHPPPSSVRLPRSSIFTHLFGDYVLDEERLQDLVCSSKGRVYWRRNIHLNRKRKALFVVAGEVDHDTCLGYLH